MMRYTFSLLILMILLSPVVHPSTAWSSPNYPGTQIGTIDLDSSSVTSKTYALNYLLDSLVEDYPDEGNFLDTSYLKSDDLKNLTSEFNVHFYGIKTARSIAFYNLEKSMTEDNLSDIIDSLTGNGLFSAWDTTINTSSTSDVATATPEPTTILLFGFGLLGLAGVSRRKR